MSRNEGDEPDLKRLLTDLMEIDSYPTTRGMLVASQALLSIRADSKLNALVSEAHAVGDGDRVELLSQFRAFLERCRRDGLEDVFPANHPNIDPRALSAVEADMQRADEAEAHYDRTGIPASLTVAATAWRRVLNNRSLDSAYPGLRAALSNNAGRLMLRRYLAMGDIPELDGAITALRAAVALTPRRSVLRSGRLGNLGLAIREQYRRTGDAETLNYALELFLAAAKGARDPVVTATAHTNLALGFQDRYLRTEDPSDLDRAVDSARLAYGTVKSADAAVTLGDVLRLRYQATGDRDSLASAVAMLRGAVAAAPATTPRQPRHLVDLGIALLDLHAAGGDAGDLVTALDLLGSAHDSIAPSSPDYPAALAHLSLAHLRRYESTGALDDLNSAVDGLRKATDAAGSGADSPAWMANLAAALHERARRTDAAEDLDSAIALLENLSAAPSGSVNRFAVANNLGNALRDRYRLANRPQDLDRAIEVLGAALNLAPERSAHTATVLANLGAAQHDRYSLGRSEQDLQEAHQRLRQAIEMTGAADLDRPRRLFAFALASRALFDLTADPSTRDAADRTFAEACVLGQTVDPVETLAAGQEWGTWAAAQQRWPDAARALDVALDALMAVVRTQLTREQKEAWLHEALVLPARAALANTQINRLPSAVRALEIGRAVVLTDTLKRERLNLGVLATERPDLVERFDRASSRLRHAEVLRAGATPGSIRAIV